LANKEHYHDLRREAGGSGNVSKESTLLSGTALVGQSFDGLGPMVMSALSLSETVTCWPQLMGG
jgi:hypothetical protein